MSIKATKWALDQRGLSCHQKAILFVLADHADENGANCYPPKDLIMSESGATKSTYYREINQLEQLGLISQQNRHFILHLDTYCAEVVSQSETEIPTVGKEQFPEREKPSQSGNTIPSVGTKFPEWESLIYKPPINHQLTTNKPPSAHAPPNDNFTEPDSPAKSETDQAVDEWNVMAKQNDIPKAMGMNPTRRKAMKARLADCQAMQVTWSEIVERVGDSDFLSGRSGDWRITGIDWALKPANFTKILEGAYDNRAQKSPRNLTDDDLWNANIAAAAGVE